jgi:CDP-diacylglycerol--glycerol-3-phosphate 3-phosphatidyltransferase
MTGGLLSWDEYAIRWAGVHGGIDLVDATGIFRTWSRSSYLVGRGLARLRVPAAAVTATGLGLCVAVPVLAGQGPRGTMLAALAALTGAFADAVDGSVAVLRSRVTRLGYLYDAVADRLGEAAWLLALWLVGVPGWLAVACGLLVYLHEYVRAKAIAAGMLHFAVVTAAERATRIVVTVLGLALAGLAGLSSSALGAGVATAAVGVWIVLGLVGLAQLMSTVDGLLRSGRS